VNAAVSLVSSIPRVREILVAKMRAFATGRDIVMEGRDIGSVVFPRTPFKFYIDATLEIRLQRRKAQGERDRISARDRADSTRTSSPLVMAPDAYRIDTSDLTIEEVINQIVGQLKRNGMIGL
jgi:cytidylate kinase